jgi:hypothetical protein
MPLSAGMRVAAVGCRARAREAPGECERNARAGPRSGSTAVLPHQAVVLALELVAVVPGPLPLPDIQLAVGRYGASLRPLAGRRVLALPPAVPRPGLAEAALDAAVVQLQL